MSESASQIAYELSDCTVFLHLQNMLPALKEHALHGELENRMAALLGLEAVGHHAVLLEMVHSVEVVPALLTCCCDASREVSLADVSHSPLLIDCTQRLTASKRKR